MTKFYETVIDVLKQDNRFFTEDGVLLRNAVYEAAMQMDVNLISILLGNETTKAQFFKEVSGVLDCQHFFRQIFLGYFPDIVQAFDTLGRNVYGDDYTSLHNPIVLSSVLLVYGMFHSTQILF